MTSWGDDEPIFVDTATSDTEAPRSAGWILWLGVVAVVGVIGLTLAALSVGDDTTPAVEAAEPTVDVEPTATPTPEAEITDEQDTLADITAFGTQFEPSVQLSSNGRSVCVGSRLSTAFGTCRVLQGEGQSVEFDVTRADSIACVFGSAASTIERVEFENFDSTFSVVELHPIDNSDARAFAICRPESVGIFRLAAYDESLNLVFSGGSHERPILEHEALAVGLQGLVAEVPPGWHLARVDGVMMVSNRRLRFTEFGRGIPGGERLCDVRQLQVLENAPEDAVVLVATTTPSPGLSDDDMPFVFEPAEISGAAASCAFDLGDRTARVARAPRQGRGLEVVIVEGVAVAEDVRQQAAAVAATIAPARSADSELLAGTVGSFGAEGAWTGEEVLLRGGFSTHPATAFSATDGAATFAAAGGGLLFELTPSKVAAAYNPVTGSWRELADPNAFDLRFGPSETSSLWTGREWLVFGSQGFPGERYDPASDVWTPISLAPGAADSSVVSSVWAGEEAYVWFEHANLSPRLDGYAYSPATDVWRPVAVPPDVPGPSVTLVSAQSEVLVVGSRGLFASYSPATDSWTVLPDSTVRASANIEAAEFTSEGLVVFTRELRPPSVGNSRATVHVYDPSSGTWTAEELPREPADVFSASMFVGYNLVVLPSRVEEQTGEMLTTSALIRRPGGALDELVLPPDWNRCGSTFVALDDAVLVWGGQDCNRFAGGHHDAVVIDIPS